MFSLELDNEEFDPNKLYFKEHNEDIFKDRLYIDALSYEGGKIEFEVLVNGFCLRRDSKKTDLQNQLT